MSQAGRESGLTAARSSSYDCTFISLAVQRIFASFTAVAVLVMSIDCACASGMSSMKQVGGATAERDAGAMPCCAHREGAAHHCKHQNGDGHKHQPNPCDGACEHCARR